MSRAAVVGITWTMAIGGLSDGHCQLRRWILSEAGRSTFSPRTSCNAVPGNSPGVAEIYAEDTTLKFGNQVLQLRVGAMQVEIRHAMAVGMHHESHFPSS
jgi:hypothetical protein